VTALLTAPSVAVTVAGVLAPAPVPTTTHEYDNAPPGTVTELPTGSTGDELASDTDVPPAGAAALSVTLSVTFPPLCTDVGAAEKAESTGAFTVTVAVFVTDPSVADTVTAVLVATPLVVAVVVPVVAPDAIAIVPAPTESTDGVPLLTDTVTPPGGAGAFRCAVNTAADPPLTVDGPEIDDNAGGLIVSTTCLVTAPRTAEIVTVAADDTGDGVKL